MSQSRDGILLKSGHEKNSDATNGSNGENGKPRLKQVADMDDYKMSDGAIEIEGDNSVDDDGGEGEGSGISEFDAEEKQEEQHGAIRTKKRVSWCESEAAAGTEAAVLAGGGMSEAEREELAVQKLLSAMGHSGGKNNKWKQITRKVIATQRASSYKNEFSDSELIPLDVTNALWDDIAKKVEKFKESGGDSS